jgi:purine-binding chemotaxis protein CheW
MPLPLAPAHIPGVVSLRNQVVPLLDLGRFLELAPRAAAAPGEAGRPGRIVLVTAAGMRVGLLCDRVLGIEEVPPSRLRRCQVVQGEALVEHAQEAELEAGVLVVLSLERLLEAASVRR